MPLTKSQYVSFKNSAGYEACRKDVAEAVESAVREMVVSEDVSDARRNFLRGFVMGCSSMLDWEPTFEEEEEDNA